jgi:hypothetical protein
MSYKIYYDLSNFSVVGKKKQKKTRRRIINKFTEISALLHS